VIELLQEKEQARSMKNPLYQTYRQDLNVLDTIRRKKVVSLQDTAFKSEIETIKQIEKRWSLEPDSTKESSKKDVLLDESAGIVSDLAVLKGAQKPAIQGKSSPSLN
jgi:carboxyl-terminal processing protease